MTDRYEVIIYWSEEDSAPEKGFRRFLVPLLCREWSGALGSMGSHASGA